MSLRELPFNDLMAQCSKKLIKKSSDVEQKRINEINNCNHLFVKLRDYADSCIVECVHCGVTNKYTELENTLQKCHKSLEYYVYTNLHCTDLEYNERTIETMMMEKILNENKQINMMSNRVIRSYHPGVLYEIAKTLKPDGDLDELFDIMNELHDLETIEERNRINNINEAEELINRYKENVKVLKK